MITQQKNRIKAALLMTVFSLNTIIGFACAVGVDMDFNSTHHHNQEPTATTVHVHADGEKHKHNSKVYKHDNKVPDHHQKSNDGKEDDNCCTDGAMKFNQLDKACAQFTQFNAIFFTTFISSFFHIDVFASSQTTPSIKYFVRSYHPPIPDIRIAIQSFQI
ncbi:MAG: hypothetical protein ABIR18_00250 [Chitinophagaceae bacterium]